jgi:hypothetical protein
MMLYLSMTFDVLNKYYFTRSFTIKGYFFSFSCGIIMPVISSTHTQYADPHGWEPNMRGFNDVHRFDISAGDLPTAVNMCVSPAVIMFKIQDCPVARYREIKGILACGRRNYGLNTRYPGIKAYFAEEFGCTLLLLIEDPSDHVLRAVIECLVAPVSFAAEFPPPFEVSPSVHDRIVSYREWSEAMHGETAGEYEVASWNIYCQFQGWPHVGQPTCNLANFFEGITTRLALQPEGLHMMVDFV